MWPKKKNLSTKLSGEYESHSLDADMVNVVFCPLTDTGQTGWVHTDSFLLELVKHNMSQYVINKSPDCIPIERSNSQPGIETLIRSGTARLLA